MKTFSHRLLSPWGENTPQRYIMEIHQIADEILKRAELVAPTTATELMRLAFQLRHYAGSVDRSAGHPLKLEGLPK